MGTRLSWQLLVISSLSVSLVSPALQAQAAAYLAPSVRVRVSAPPRAVAWEGTLVGVDSGAARSLVLRRSTSAGWSGTAAQTDTISLASIHRLETYAAGRRSAGRIAGNAALGALIGAAVGAGAGYLIESGNGCDGGYCGLAAVVLGLGGGATGLLVGGLVGARRSGRWEAVPIPGSP